MKSTYLDKEIFRLLELQDKISNRIKREGLLMSNPKETSPKEEKVIAIAGELGEIIAETRLLTDG